MRKKGSRTGKAEPRAVGMNPHPIDRRRLLIAGGALSGALAGDMLVPQIGRAEDASNLPPNVPEWMKHEGLPLQGQPYTLPSKFEKHVARKGRGDEAMPGSGSIQSPLQDLRGMITPSGLTFERSHAGVPEIDPTQHRLIVHGLVKRPLIFTMDDIVRFPSVSRIHFLECSGNGSREWRKPLGDTVQITHGLMSCCEWTGVLLSTVLQETGLMEGASWVLAEGADACALSRSVPIEKCFEDAMLVYGQNGEMLRPQQGYPLRLFLPGFEGNMNVVVAAAQGRERAVHDARGNVQVHRLDAGRQRAAIHVHHGSEVRDYPSFAWFPAQGQGLLRNLGACLERHGTDPAGGCLG